MNFTKTISKLSLVAAALCAPSMALATNCGSGGYDVKVAIAGSQKLGSLQVELGYSPGLGAMSGEGEAVACVKSGAVGGALAMFNDHDSENRVIAGFVSPMGFQSPLEVFTCRFEVDAAAPAAADFTVTIDAAAGPDGSALPVPAASVTVVPADGNPCGIAACGNGELEADEQCDAGTLNSDGADSPCRTDCTLPGCGDGVVDLGEECDDGDLNSDGIAGACGTDCHFARTCGDADSNGRVSASDAMQALRSAVGLGGSCELSVCDVNGSGDVTAIDARLILGASIGGGDELTCAMPIVVSLDSAAQIGAIDIVIDYSASGTTFFGAGDAVECVSLVTGAVATVNNDVASGKLHIGLMGVSPITGPAVLIACNARPVSGLTASGFVVESIDAVGADLEPVPAPAIGVTW